MRPHWVSHLLSLLSPFPRRCTSTPPPSPTSSSKNQRTHRPPFTACSAPSPCKPHPTLSLSSAFPHPPAMAGNRSLLCRFPGVAAAAAAVVVVIVVAGGVTAAEGTTLAFYNKCSHPVWPGIQPSAGRPILARGGFRFLPNQAYSLSLPSGWSGRVWGRQDCAFDAAGRGRCATGDCGSGLYCAGAGGAPPATLAELTLGPQQDFYDVSLVDGYNLGMSITPFHRGGGARSTCASAGCVSDLNTVCPAGLAVRSGHDGRVVACKSACYAFRSDRYCCTGSFGSPQQCKPTAYSRLFKTACPRAYSYAFDDPTSIVTCAGASYVVTFCPRAT